MYLQHFEKLQSRNKRRKFSPGSRVFTLCVKIRSPCALQASLQIFGRRMRTYIPRLRRGIGSKVLPQPTQKAPTGVPFVLAGVAGFGPTNARVKVWCLTAWLYPIFDYPPIIPQKRTSVKICFYFFEKTFCFFQRFSCID